MLLSVMLFSVLNGGDLSRLTQLPQVLQDLWFTVEVYSHDRGANNDDVDSRHFSDTADTLIQLILSRPTAGF